jgi:cyclic pyranopterin phosphate synthase
MPPWGVPSRRHEEILRYEEVEKVVRAASSLGISKVRLTGGEPLVRKGILDLVHRLANIQGIDDLAMTTNGTLLARWAYDLKEAGLKRVNVSLDTLRPERFRRITRLGNLNDVLEGIEAARRAGLTPIKINTVVIKGMNEDEVVDFARLTLDGDWHIRFIELMPIGKQPLSDSCFVSAGEVRSRIESALGKLEPAKMGVGGGPARYYRLRGGKGTVGFITPISEHFCYRCNRLRLTADGKLRPCLLSDYEIDLRSPLRRGAGIDEIRNLIVEGIESKPRRHRLSEMIRPSERAMSEIGG